MRLGHLSKDVKWTIKPLKIAELLKGKIQITDLTEHDVSIETRQKGVDMRIGVDVASLSFKQQVNQIVLIAGDADFVPAAKWQDGKVLILYSTQCGKVSRMG